MQRAMHRSPQYAAAILIVAGVAGAAEPAAEAGLLLAGPEIVPTIVIATNASDAIKEAAADLRLLLEVFSTEWRR